MDVFSLRNSLIDDYSSYISSFINIKDPRINEYVSKSINEGLLWPDPLIQLNPSFKPGKWIDELVEEGLLHPECKYIFRRKNSLSDFGQRFRVHQHQEDAIRSAKSKSNYILTTGTGSGKSLSYIIPIVDNVLRGGSGRGIKAVIIYPMNALANSQIIELEKFLQFGYPDGKGPVTFRRYTGQEGQEERDEIRTNPPDILLTNYVMWELILTRKAEHSTIVQHAQNLQFIVLDELHTYRGRQGADVSMLIRRTKQALNCPDVQCVGTSATMSSGGSLLDQKIEVAKVAHDLFGARFETHNIIGETLRRSTVDLSFSNPDTIKNLSDAIHNPLVPTTFTEMVNNPLSAWIESTIGIRTDQESEKLVRALPNSILGDTGLANTLSQLTSIDTDICAKKIEKFLLAGYRITQPDSTFPVFAFRVHQFISRGDTVFVSLENEKERHITVHGQQFVPGSRDKSLLPLAFCRECGQEYYVVASIKEEKKGKQHFVPRDLQEMKPEGGEAGYLYINSENPWPIDIDKMIDLLPEDWLDDDHGKLIVKSSQKRNLPQNVWVDTLGSVVDYPTTIPFTYVKASMRFCLNCGVVYNARQQSEIQKLTQLSTGGRSTDTTILSLSMVQQLKKDGYLDPEARKLLSFTDNRQDASLQSGHFNDFIEVTSLRAAVYRAISEGGEKGIRDKDFPEKVYESLELKLQDFALDPTVKFAAKDDAINALIDVLRYKLYRDLRRGWRITSPNLEQCGLLHIKYRSLDELCGSEESWNNFHEALTTAPPETRFAAASTLLDYLRRELAINAPSLSSRLQQQIAETSRQQLIAPWALDESEKLEHSSFAFPRKKTNDKDDYGGNIYLSPQSSIGMYLRRPSTFPNLSRRLNFEDASQIFKDLLLALKSAGILREMIDDDGGVPGYQINNESMVWTLGDGTGTNTDPIRVPRPPKDGNRTNQYFKEFYRNVGTSILHLEAHEHTAQVPSDERQKREDLFRTAELPILFCSPTMELGVDISQLNVVNMRNVPPTPANYAQRSGRAGRQGQPALVYTYCTQGSPHDQYYFQHKSRMVAGAVTPPRVDITNEDLIRSHVHAIWLAQSGLDLKTTLKELLDLSVSGVYPLNQQVKDSLNSESIKNQARKKSQSALADIETILQQTDWWNDTWLTRVFDQLELSFDKACDRWRDLYKSAQSQLNVQNAIIQDAHRNQQDRETARRLYNEATNQLNLLVDSKNLFQSDFSSYRYLASEGFLPGYSFPRLPLSAFIPARNMRRQANDEFLSRPRFLAISEFGPQSIIYHEGSRYVINKVNIPLSNTGDGVDLVQAKQCGKCGYIHPYKAGEGIDLCDKCKAPLDEPLVNLFRMQNVSTKRRDKISSDEEERMRQGYELRTAYRFADHGGKLAVRTAELVKDGKVLAKLSYGAAAALWRINMGWKRSITAGQVGFTLDIERGYWASQEDEKVDANNNPLSSRKKRVIPFVEDHKNILIIEPEEYLEPEVMASLQSALKNAILVEFQLEDNEIAAEPLPSNKDRRKILFFESAEGGAGVLRRLVDDPSAFPRLAQTALTICHFDPQTGEDRHHAETDKEDCEAACYNCLLSYGNQMDHKILDRQSIKDTLLEFSQVEVSQSPQASSREDHFAALINRSESDLEKKWLRELNKRGMRLPSQAQYLIQSCSTRPDFYYEPEMTAIYIDGSHHDYPDRQIRDQAQTTAMEDAGYIVIRFSYEDDWEKIFKTYPSLFGGK
jgi:ATP-dependent helicase YprA (DUF1998 family)/very-short-patch-repair endonuclease